MYSHRGEIWVWEKDHSVQRGQEGRMIRWNMNWSAELWGSCAGSEHLEAVLWHSYAGACPGCCSVAQPGEEDPAQWHPRVHVSFDEHEKLFRLRSRMGNCCPGRGSGQNTRVWRGIGFKSLSKELWLLCCHLTLKEWNSFSFKEASQASTTGGWVGALKFRQKEIPPLSLDSGKFCCSVPPNSSFVTSLSP